MLRDYGFCGNDEEILRQKGFIMEIDSARKKVIRAFADLDIDLRSCYKLQRAYLDIAKPRLAPKFFNIRDKAVSVFGRNIQSRMYFPEKQTRDYVMLFYHGGGWVTESVNTYDLTCLYLANRTGCRVVSVEYRLAPEHPFPEGLDDCYDYTYAVMKKPEILETERDNIILIGDSAGGNFAAVISMLMRDMNEFHIKRQILIYPATYNDHSENSPFRSIVENGKGYILTSKHISAYMDLYVRDKFDLQNPYVAPLLASDFTNLPKTLVITAEFDPLRDEGEYFGYQLRKNGNNVSIYRIKDAMHGFFAGDIYDFHVRQAHHIINKFLDEDDGIELL